MHSAAGEARKATSHSPRWRRRKWNPDSFRELLALVEVGFKVCYLFCYLRGWEAAQANPALQIRLTRLGEVARPHYKDGISYQPLGVHATPPPGTRATTHATKLLEPQHLITRQRPILVTEHQTDGYAPLPSGLQPVEYTRQVEGMTS